MFLIYLVHKMQGENQGRYMNEEQTTSINLSLVYFTGAGEAIGLWSSNGLKDGGTG